MHIYINIYIYVVSKWGGNLLAELVTIAARLVELGGQLALLWGLGLRFEG